MFLCKFYTETKMEQNGGPGCLTGNDNYHKSAAKTNVKYYIIPYMKKIILILPLALSLTGCYTVLLTRSYVDQHLPARTAPAERAPVLVADSTLAASDSGRGSLAAAPAAAPASADTVYINQSRSGCDCTPFEIESGYCWCVCDRCGHYHRLGYQYCPSTWGIYSSWGGNYWDNWGYYNDYPYWADPYYGNNMYIRGYYSSGDRGGRHGGHEGYNSPAPVKGKSGPMVGDRKTYRQYYSPPATNANPAPSPGPSPKPANANPGPSSPTASPAPSQPAAQPASPPPNNQNDKQSPPPSNKSPSDEMNRKRVR
jgi:hypothetical protein